MPNLCHVPPRCTAPLYCPPVQDRERRIQESRKTVDAQRRAFAESGTRAFTTQPDYLKGGCSVGLGVGWKAGQGKP